MTDTSNIAGGRAPGNPATYNPLAGTSFPPGTPVRQDLAHDDTVLPGQADSPDTTIVTGIAIHAAVSGFRARNQRVLVQYSGPLTLTVEQWSEITGNSNGLLRGVPYFLSSTAAGKLTTDAPTEESSFVAPVGVGLSPTTLHILLSFPSANGTPVGLKRERAATVAATSSSSGKAG
jgi:hypothetical protein